MSKLTDTENKLIDTIVNKQCFTHKQLSKEMFFSIATINTILGRIYMKKNLPVNNIGALVWDYYNNKDTEQIK